MISRAVKTTIRRVFVWAILLTLTPLVEAKQLYRYRNAEGSVVVDYQVPAESVGGGYEILNDKGVVIEVVPPEPTAEEKVRDREAIAEQERLRKWDETLMLRYSTVADIEDARQRALGDLQIRMTILRGNKRALKQEVENYQAQAADTERAGKSVGVERLRMIEDLQNEIAVTERAINERQREMEELSAAYSADIERFENLQEAVELRRSLSVKSTPSR
jgi:hypothetical protein